MEHTNAEQTQQCEVVSEVTQHPLYGSISISVAHIPVADKRPDTVPVNHPDYMRLVVHEMD
jgi:hypothetical protein